MTKMYIFWAVAIVAFGFLEGITAQLVSIWFVLGSVCAAITSIFTDSVPIQSAVFLVVSLIALVVTRPLVNKIRQKKGKTSTNADRLIGKIGIVISDIEDVQKVGQVKVEGEIWTAKSQSAPIAKDSKIKVLAIEGVKLLVEPVE